MDEALKGNTNSSLTPSTLGNSGSTLKVNSSGKKMAFAAVVNISNSLNAISSQVNSISAQVTTQTEIAQRAQLIELAKSLGDIDMLRSLLAAAQGEQAGGQTGGGAN